jgi:hypothetical protein
MAKAVGLNPQALLSGDSQPESARQGILRTHITLGRSAPENQGKPPHWCANSSDSTGRLQWHD